MSDATSPYQTCYYTIVNNRIHEVTFFESSHAAVDEFLIIWDTKIMPHWHNQTGLSPEILLLVDLGRTKPLPPDYTIRQFKQYITQQSWRPPIRVTYLHGVAYS